VTPPENDRKSAENPELSPELMRLLESDAFLDEILAVYESLDNPANGARAICLGGGACCRFDLFDHRLYVTLGELALLSRTKPKYPSRIELNRCPYQQGPRCTARGNRPLGCRVFFCREQPGAGYNELYEEAHRRIRRLHESFNMPYSYMELISALKILAGFAVDTE